MADIATNLQKLVDDRDDIRTALVAKGVTAASTHGFDDFATDIASIESGVSSDVLLEIINATTPIATLDTYPYSYGLKDRTSSDYIHSTADTSYVYKLDLLKNLYVNTSWSIDNGTSSSYTTVSKITMCLILYENGTEISRSTKDAIKSTTRIQRYRPSIKFPISDFASFYSEHPNGIFKVSISVTQTSSPTIRAELTAITITDV